MKLKDILVFILTCSQALVLLHEYVTEGYVFDPIDLITPEITHEKIWLALIIILFVIGRRRKQ